MEELLALPGSKAVATNQVLYNLPRRGGRIRSSSHRPRRARTCPIIAYSPIEQGRLLHHAALLNLAQSHGVTPARVALAWVLNQPSICAIPRAGKPEHVRDNHAALALNPTTDDLAELDAAFPPPARKVPLEILTEVYAFSTRP